MKNPNFIPGWTYLGFGRMQNLPKKLQGSLKNIGDRVTIKLEDRYILYENKGDTIGEGTNNRPLFGFHRRFRKHGGKEE